MKVISFPASEATDFNIPKTSIRGYSIFNDMVLVDRRRVLRQIRTARRQKCHPELLDWWRRRLNKMERYYT